MCEGERQQGAIPCHHTTEPLTVYSGALIRALYECKANPLEAVGHTKLQEQNRNGSTK